LWNYCNVLRDDGMSYGDYVEQLTYLLFLKMADERTRPPYSQQSPVPEQYAWPSLLKKDGDELFDHYRHTLEALGNEKGLLGLIFNKSQNKFQDPAKLRRLVVDLIDKEQWVSMSADVKGDAYEGLLEKNAQDTKSGAGQYFTPRPLIQAIVDVMAPKPGETVCDPACGTGGFLLAAHDYVVYGAPLRDEHAATRHRQPGLRAHCGGRLAGRRSRRALRARAHEPALRQEEQHHDRRRRRQGEQRARRGRARRLLDHHLEQATQLRPAREVDVEDSRQGGGGGA
jgi:hypothetical protein